ncbi:MAG TPA: glycosyltransferase family 2 protein [Thermoanaerobaculia bacterium]|nr:glycosyltransferase family 2 protein [Thermoanaerobaculia bacterium]
MKSLFFIPVYNQAQELPGLLDELRAASPLACDTLLLVNNGSDDGSAELVRASGFPWLDLPRNRGVGHAFMQAVDWALERGYDVLGVLAGNGKMLPAEMPRVLDPILRGQADYVTGSRFLTGGASPNMPRFRETSIPLVNTFVRLLTGARVTDATCGYRAYRLALLHRAEFDWHTPWLDTYAFEYYLYAKVLLDRRIRWMEAPITMRYPPPGRRYTKIKPFLGWYDMLKPWVVARFDGRGFAEEPQT